MPNRNTRIEQLQAEVHVLRAAIEQRDLMDASRPAPKPKKPVPTVGTIYYFRNEGLIKIGWTSDLKRRLRSYPPGATLLAAHPGTRADERKLHKRFGHLLSDGREWFVPAPDLKAHIEGVIRQHGPPPDLHLGARPAQVRKGATQHTQLRHRPLPRR